jgi:hypothetical protein
MTSICAIIPVANLLTANATLESQGHGTPNFTVPCYGTGGNPTHAAMHAFHDPVFFANIKALPGVVWEEGAGDPVTRTAALIAGRGAQWGQNAPMLPTTGNAVANTLYRYGTEGEEYWWCIQTFSRSTFNAPPATYPALIRRARRPGEVLPWVQPIDQFDAYKLVNAFNGQPDRCTHAGNTWKVTQADGAGNNVWQPGVFGWTQV